MAAAVEKFEDRTLLSAVAFSDSARRELMIDTQFDEDVLDESIEDFVDPSKTEFAWINAV